VYGREEEEDAEHCILCVSVGRDCCFGGVDEVR
jgi:hypothetical protein